MQNEEIVHHRVVTRRNILTYVGFTLLLIVSLAVIATGAYMYIKEKN